MSPLFSIIIPTKDRPQMLLACLASLSRLDFSRDEFQVIVVDDGSQTSPVSICDGFLDKLPIHLLRQPVSLGPASTRNQGAEWAQGKYLVFLDDDCIVAPQWLRAFAADFTKTDNNALVGSTENATPAVIGAQVWCLNLAFQYAYWRDGGGNLKIAISNNFAVDHKAFDAVGGFDGSFPLAASEDRDFSWRFNEAGYTIGQSAGAVVWHTQPSLTMANYLKLQFRYGVYANIQRKKQKAETAADFARRFGSNSRLRYVFHLLRFAGQNQATVKEIVVLFLGHVSHFLGRLAEASGMQPVGKPGGLPPEGKKPHHQGS